MKKILNILLSLAIVCSTACDKNEPQHVSFNIDTIESGPEGIRTNIKIEANCRWSIKNEDGRTYTEIQEGEGTMETTLIVFSNPKYDSGQYTVTVTSEDGSSSDAILVYQEEQYGLEVMEPKTVVADGGTFQVPVKTNVNVTDIVTSDWIKYTSGRALTCYTYTFTAEPNTSGSPRTGFISMKGEHYISERIKVSQESFDPEEVILPSDILVTQYGTATTQFSVLPEYADMSKLEISSSNGCTSKMSGNNLSFTMRNHGLYSYSLQTRDKKLAEGEVLFLPRTLIDKDCTNLFYVGQRSKLELNFSSDKFEYSSSNPDVVSISTNGEMQMNAEGSSLITVSVPGSDFSESRNVLVEPVLFSAFIDSYISWLGDVYITAVVHGKNITDYAFATADHGQSIIMPQAVKRGECPEGKDCLIYQGHVLNFYINDWDKMEERLSKLVVEFSGTVDGKKIRLTTCVLPEKADWMDCQ